MPKKSKKATGKAADRILFENAIKTLSANIRFASIDNPIRVVGVTSSIPSEGKSTTAYALAQAFASGGEKVLLLDCDLRGRSLASKIGFHPAAGIYSVLTGQVELDDAVVKVSDNELYYLDCEPQIPNPLDVLSSRRFAKLIARLRTKYAYIVIDTPPLSAFVDGAVVSQNVDGMLLVVRQDFVRREEVLSAYEQLRKAGANVIGTVLNYCRAERNDYLYHSRYNPNNVGESAGFGTGAGPSVGAVSAAAPSSTASRSVVAAAGQEVSRAEAPAVGSPSPSHTAPSSPTPPVSRPGLRPLPVIDDPADSTMELLIKTGYGSNGSRGTRDSHGE